MFDLVDYWNLRAAGFRVFPLPTNNYRDYANGANAFMRTARYRWTSGLNLVEIVKSRSVSDEELAASGKWLGSLGLQGAGVSLKRWIPHFGERHFWVAPEVSVQPVIGKESEEVVVITDGYGTLQPPPLPCELGEYGPSQHWATEIQVSDPPNEACTFKFPWLYPHCDAVANEKIGNGFSAESTRVSKQGIVIVRDSHRKNVWIEEPKVKEVFAGYLRDASIRYLKTSSPGLALERIVDQLEGFHSCAIFRNAGVRSLIEKAVDGAPRKYPRN